MGKSSFAQEDYTPTCREGTQVIYDLKQDTLEMCTNNNQVRILSEDANPDKP